MKDPILIVQMQRMGDLVLSFPLIIDLRLSHGDTPIWVVAEEIFYAPLMRLAPSVTFFSPAHLPMLVGKPFSLIINISTRPEAAQFLAKARADRKLGPIAADGTLRIRGFWHLYRHSLTQNNRHNTFHWADLNRLDLYWRRQDVPQRGHRIGSKTGRRIGLVLGASQTFKHPDCAFWTVLAKTLMRRGCLPFLFGGQGEAAMGEAVARDAGVPGANLCGKLSVDELAAWFGTLALCITPDTGPMHLADWLAVPVLNLSMGSVRAHETGPYSEGQTILTPAMSCAGCWQCDDKDYRCKMKFRASRVARCAISLLEKKGCDPGPQLALMTSARSDNLFVLSDGSRKNSQTALDTLHRALFLSLWEDRLKEPGLQAELSGLDGRLLDHMEKTLDSLCFYALEGMRGGRLSLAGDLLTQTPPALRLLIGFLESYLQNDDMSRTAWREVCQWLAWFRDCFRTL